MSQVSIIDIAGNNPQIPLQFDADIDFAVPIGNVLEILGDTVPAGILPVYTEGSGNTITINVQIAQAIAATNALNVGLAAFNSAHFTVDANGFVSLVSSGGGSGITNVIVDTFTIPGTNPVLPSGAGAITVTGAQVATGIIGANVIRTTSLAANAYTIQIQRATSAVASNPNLNGVSHFNSANFTVGTDGFVSLSATPPAPLTVGLQSGTTPISPTAGGLITFNGTVVAAGTNPVRTFGSLNTMALQVQIAQAIASTNATNIGLAAFRNTDFAVDANGFVSLATTGAAKTITGDDAVVLSPVANNWNILGRSGSKTSGAGATLTIKSPPFSQVGAGGTSSLNTGEFVTAAATRTLPASAGLADGDLFIYVCTTASALVIQSVGAQRIRVGNQISAVAGTLTSTAIGDSISLRFNGTDGFFYAVSSIGNWTIA
jgi:hypothetical protein